MDTDGTPGQGQMGLEEFCQWPVLRNGVDRPQIRSYYLTFFSDTNQKNTSLRKQRFLPLFNLVIVV